VAAATAAVTAGLMLHYEKEFESALKKYRRLVRSIVWVGLSVTRGIGHKAPKNEVKHRIMDLCYVDMGKVVKHLCLGPDVDRRLCGFLPTMATTSQGFR